MASSNRIRLAEARTEFIDRLGALGRSAETIRVHNGMLGRLIRDLGDIQVVNVSNKHVRDWLYGLRGEHRTDQHGRRTNPGVSPATFNQTRSMLRGFFNWCQEEGHTRHTPMAGISGLKVPKRQRQRPTVEQLLSMLESVDFPRDRVYVAVANNTALRQCEILRIRCGDVDLNAGYVSVVIQKTGDVDEQPISSDLDRELRRWLIHYEDQIGRPLGHDDYLIPTTTSPKITRREGGRICRGPRTLVPERPPVRMEKVVQRAMASIGMETHQEGTHTIRRGVARAYFDAAAQEQGDVSALRETAALLHHSNLHTTERYLGMTAERSRRDRRIKGQPFLTALSGIPDNVVPFKASGDQASSA